MTEFLNAIGYGFLGGLLLNLMPCVFPILSLKAFDLLRMHQDKDAQRQRHALQESAFYVSGILVSLWFLAGGLYLLRALGQEVGWGFQLSSPGFVLGMIATLYFIALYLLNLLPDFQLPTLGGQVLTHPKDPRTHKGMAFLTGTLAVLVSTPCSAPFMGVALSYALAHSPALSFGVFTALGLGLGTPHLLFALFPALVQWLPRSGHWMEILKQFLAFPVLGTVLWLLWLADRLLPQRGFLVGLALLLSLSFLAWVRTTSLRLRRTSVTLGLWCVLVGVTWLTVHSPLMYLPAGAQAGGSLQSQASLAEDVPLVWKPFSPEAVQKALQLGRPVFIDFTADWCLTCKVNEHAVLETQGFKDAVRAHGFVLLKADWTRGDALITKALRDLGRNSIPVYALYGRGYLDHALLLPQILTLSSLRKQMQLVAKGE